MNTKNVEKYKYQQEIQSMMYTFGDVRNSLPETTQLVEEIVKSQIIELALQAAAQAQKKGSKSLVAEDVMFLIRHDHQKVNRLKEFLSWKDVRKNVKTQDEAEIGEEGAEKSSSKAKKKVIKLSWDIFTDLKDALDSDSDDEQISEDEMAAETFQRLREADLITRAMNKEEYIDYSECRQASFTFKKAKRFKDWTNLQHYTEIKFNDDIIEIFGFLCWEMVHRITEISLGVKKDFELASPTSTDKSSSFSSREYISNPLFASPKAQTPIEPVHVREAFRRMQQNNPFLSVFSGGFVKKRVRLI